MKVEIKKRFSGEIILCGEYESIGECLEKNRDADLSDADLRGADLSGADLSGADLSGADLSGADLSGADLSDADLSGADLSGADLSGADLSDADLRCAYLSGADHNGEKLDKEPIQLIGLKYFVLITKEQMKIGCELHKIDEWKKFTDKEIISMDGKDALKWWNDNKEILFKLNEKHCE